MAVKNFKRGTSASLKRVKTVKPVAASAIEAVAVKAEPVKVEDKSAPVEPVAVDAAPVLAEPAPAAVAEAKPVTTAKPAPAPRTPVRKAMPKKLTPNKAIVKAAPVAKVAKPMKSAAQTAVVTPAVPKVAETVQKDINIMATVFEIPKFEAPKLFGDLNDKTKAAVEKSTKLVEEFNDFAKGNVEAIVESGKIAAKGFETLGQDVADYNRKSFEGLTATMKSFASIKSPTDFFKLQSDFVRASFDAAVAQGSKNTEAFIKLAGDAAQPLSSRFAVAAEKVKAAA